MTAFDIAWAVVCLILLGGFLAYVWIDYRKLDADSE